MNPDLPDKVYDLRISYIIPHPFLVDPISTRFLKSADGRLPVGDVASW